MEIENSEQSAFPNRDEISLKELIMKAQEWWLYLMSKWILILGFGLLGAIFGYFYAKSMKFIYLADTLFVLEEGGSGGGGIGQYAGIASSFGIDIGGATGGGIFQGDNIQELYKSRKMIEKTLLSEVIHNGRKKLLIDEYVEFKNLRSSWDEKIRLQNISFIKNLNQNFSRLQDSLIGDIVEKIKVDNLVVGKPDKKLNIIKVTIKSGDEFFSKSFNDQLVKNVNDFYVQTKTKKSLENLNILQHQTDSVRNVLSGAINTTAAVGDATPNLNPTRQILRAPALKSQFNAEANKAILTQLVQNLELAKLSLRNERPLIQVIDEPVYPLYKEKLGKLKALVIGGLLSGFLTILFFTFRRVARKIME